MSQGCDLSILEELTSNAKQIQDDVLTKILKSNANTEYLSRFLEGSSDKELFKKNVPVVSYEDVKPYIDRVANGEPWDIISGEPICDTRRCSGTSNGNQKIYPANNIYFENQLFGYALSSVVISKYADGYKQGKVMIFTFTHRISKTPCVQRDEVIGVGATIPSVLVRVINFLEKYWKELASNIRSGTVSKWITDLSCRDSVSTILGEPNAELADLIEHECSGHKSWQGIITRLWPKTKYIETIVTGTMSQHIPALDYYSNELPLVSKAYASSEAFFGINVNPLTKPQHVSYTFLPNMSYFEFIEVDEDGGTTGEIVDLVNVKLGSYYEPLVTNFSGNPTTEEDISKALARATVVLESSDLILTGFTCYGDISTVPGHYVFYVEPKSKPKSTMAPTFYNLITRCWWIIVVSWRNH
ncbi:unnamed protein product [Brassica oleracea]